MIIGGYIYTKIFPVASLAAGNQTVLMEQRYGDANHLNAYYSISISGIAGQDRNFSLIWRMIPMSFMTSQRNWNMVRHLEDCVVM